jgi:hypothetical protein
MYGDQYVHTEDVHLALAKIQGGLAVEPTGGRAFWLDNGDDNATDSATAGSYRIPFSTVGYANTQTEAGRGDVIIARQTHAETIAVGVGLKEGVQLIGMGHGHFRPTFTLDGQNLAPGGTGSLVRNCRIIVADDFTDMVSMGNGSAVVGCAITLSAGTEVIDNVFRIDSGDDDVHIIGNHVVVRPSAGSNDAVIVNHGGYRMVVMNNLFRATAEDGMLRFESGNSSEHLIKDNYLWNQSTTDRDGGIISVAGGIIVGGFACGNRFWTGNNSVNWDDDSFDNDAIALFENYGTNSVGSSGKLVPDAVT